MGASPATARPVAACHFCLPRQHPCVGAAAGAAKTGCRRVARPLLLLAAFGAVACAEEAVGDAAESPDAEAGIDAKVVYCTKVVDNFNYGLVEQEEVDPVTGRLVGSTLTKADPNADPNVEVEWATYKQCVVYLTQDPWTRTEYLTYATSPRSHGACASTSAEVGAGLADAECGEGTDGGAGRSLVMGVHHPVVLAPGKPTFSRYFLVPAYDFVVGSFVRHGGTYDPTEEQVLRSLLRPGDCAVEIGANIGSYTVVIADQVGTAGLVYALEPFRKIFQIMNANLALQGYGNVVTKQVGVSSVSQFITVQAPDLNDFTNLGASRVFYQQKEEVSRVPFDGTEEIEVQTLDALRVRCPRGRLDFLKIDTEGMELEVVEGGLSLIRRDQPLIYVESQPFFQDGDDRFLRQMREYGYVCNPIPNLEMHELLLCVPIARREELAEWIPMIRSR